MITRPMEETNEPEATNSVVSLSIEIEMPDIIPAAEIISKRGSFISFFRVIELGETCLISSIVISLIVSIS